MDDDALREWRTLVNLSAQELEQWLETEESWSVGDKRHGHESVGHLAGRRTVDLLETPPGEWGPEDWRHVRKTLGVIKRHRAQQPARDVTDTRWRWSLMNWGHDPLAHEDEPQAL